VGVVDDHGLAAAGRATQDDTQVVLHEELDDVTVSDRVHRVDDLVGVVDDGGVVVLLLLLLVLDLHVQ